MAEVRRRRPPLLERRPARTAGHPPRARHAEAWQRAQTAANAGWSAWTLTGTGGSDVDLASNADGRLEAHLRRADHLWVRYQRASTYEWTDWSSFAGPGT